MAADELTFLILEYVGIVLYLYLFGHCAYRSINYTLQVICVVGILNNINETFILLMFDDRVMTNAHGTNACIVSAVFEQFLPLSIASLTTCMGFNIWFLIVRKSRKKERQILKWYCLISFGVSAFATAIAVILLRNQLYFATYTRSYYCDLEESYITLGTFAIPMLLVAMPGIYFAGRTIVYLVTQYYRLRRTRTSSRPTFTEGNSMTLELR
ncbi:hypothetical protein BGZ68_001298 [Mortierella alpina]|nr:hypothetical protein BGZ68_001298 [Mortierella alpina]